MGRRMLITVPSSNHFTLFYDRPMVVADLTTARMVPYPVVDQYGGHIVPETLGIYPRIIPSAKGDSDRARDPGGARGNRLILLSSFFCRKHCLSR